MIGRALALVLALLLFATQAAIAEEGSGEPVNWSRTGLYLEFDGQLKIENFRTPTNRPKPDSATTGAFSLRAGWRPTQALAFELQYEYLFTTCFVILSNLLLQADEACNAVVAVHHKVVGANLHERIECALAMVCMPASPNGVAVHDFVPWHNLQRPTTQAPEGKPTPETPTFDRQPLGHGRPTEHLPKSIGLSGLLAQHQHLIISGPTPEVLHCTRCLLREGLQRSDGQFTVKGIGHSKPSHQQRCTHGRLDRREQFVQRCDGRPIIDTL